jgi:hypothetical protein
MEVLGLMVAIPAVLAANVCYVMLVRFGLARFNRLRPWLLWPSCFVMTIAVGEVSLVVTLGAVSTLARIGPTFWIFHMLAFLFGAPTLANVLLLTRQGISLAASTAPAAPPALSSLSMFFEHSRRRRTPSGRGSPKSSSFRPLRKLVPRLDTEWARLADG